MMKILLSKKIIGMIVLGMGLGIGFIGWRYLYKGVRVSLLKTKKHFTMPKQNVKKTKLSNGMTVLVYSDHAAPKVLVQIAYDIGAYVEQAGERGMAHLIEHMIFKGTEKLSEGDIDEIARKYGASHNAFTSMDVTSYYFEANKNNWKPFIPILADCMQNARFDEQHLASELKAVIQELKMYQDDYWSIMYQKIASNLFPANHAYHHPIIGYKDDLMFLSCENLKNFYKKYYHPKHATLFVVGDVIAEEVFAQAREHFEPIKPAVNDTMPEFPRIPHELVVHNTKLFEEVKVPQLDFYWRIPGLKDKEEILSGAAAILLGGGEGSRLYRALVDEQKIASNLSVSDHKNMEAGVFLISVLPVEGKTEACRVAIQKELATAIATGFTEHELEHMIRSEAKDLFQKLQFAKNLTYEWLISYFATGDEYDLFERVNHFMKVTSTKVQRFIKDHLDPDLMNQIEVLPLPESKKELSKIAKKESDELDKKILAKYVRTAPIENPRYALTLPEAAPLTLDFPKPDKVLTLKNGLKVILKRNAALPIMSLNCQFKEGSFFANSLEGVLLQVMMSMLIEGSESYSKKDNIDFFEYYGADHWFTMMEGGLSILALDYEQIFERFVTVMRTPIFPIDALAKVKNIVVDGIVRQTDSPKALGVRVLRSNLFKNHPFAWTFEEAIKAVKKLTTADLIKLHRQYLTPENMILTVVGDFDTAEMEEVLNRTFNKWTEGPEVRIERVKPQFEPGKVIKMPMVRDQVVLLLGQPSEVDIHHPDLTPLELINYIAFYSMGCRIYQLREQSGLFYTAFGAWAAGATKEPGFDYMGTIVNPENVETVEKQMRELIAVLQRDGVTQDELVAARQLYLKGLIDAVSSNISVANLLGTMERYELGFDYYDNVLKRAQTLSVQDLNAICKKYFTTDKMISVRIGRV